MSAVPEIAAIYEPKLDGFVSIAHKYIRNPRSPMIIWMQRPTWDSLANHATRDGEFYIPCPQCMVALRTLVAEMEKPHDKDGARPLQYHGASGNCRATERQPLHPPKQLANQPIAWNKENGDEV